MEELYDLNKIKKDAELSDKHSYHRGYEDNKFSEEHFIKNKGDWRYEKTLDIDNERVKEYMIKHPTKFKTMCLVNIYLSRKVNKMKTKQFEEFRLLTMINIFKEYSSKYIDNPSNILLNKQNNMRKLNDFDKSYNTIFQTCKPSGLERVQKSKFKKEYKKYLDTGDIEQCKSKYSLQIFIAYVELFQQSSLTSSSSLDSISSGVST